MPTVTDKRLQHFLLVYDAAKGELRSVSTFADADRAVAAFQAAEERFSAADGVQVVLVASDSLDTVKRTRSERIPDKQLFVAMVLIAGVLIALELLLSHTRLRRLP